MLILTSAIVAVLSASNVFAEQRANKPFNTSNGRTVTSGGGGSTPQVFVVNTPGGGAAANTGAADTSTPNVAAGRAFGGGGGGRSARGVQRGGKAFMGSGNRNTRRVDAGGSGGATTSTEEPRPPYLDKPGALIRTTGQKPVYEKAEDPRIHTVDAGEIVLNKRKAYDVGRAPTVQMGPKDTLPPPNPVAGQTYGTAAAANGPTGGTGGSGSNSGGHNNNGSGNNGKDKPGDSDDGHGGDKAKEAAFYDAF